MHSGQVCVYDYSCMYVGTEAENVVSDRLQHV